MNKRPFNSELIIKEQINKVTLKAYHVGFDQEEFRLTPLVDTIRNVIPEFALGYHEGKNIPLNSIIEKLKEAAETVYLTDKYKSRGEFGELILHLLLRDFQNTIPLISKIYFKDSHNVNVHGFDCVHVTNDNNESKLWLGESKLYKDGMNGIRELATDLEEHVNADYIRKEFTLVSRKLPDDTPNIEHWRTLLDKNQKLDVIFSNIVIPMVCTYNSNIFNVHKNESLDYFRDFEVECYKLEEKFNEKKISTKIEIILMLLPIPDKDRLNSELDTRLKAMQRI